MDKQTKETSMVELLDGARCWCSASGQLHRADGPAVELANGTQFWYQNGKEHRTDGPAVEWANGTCVWYREGRLHRTDGPAVEYADGTCEWWIDGKQTKQQE